VLESGGHANQPWWFREGLALELTGDKPTDPKYSAALTRVKGMVTVYGLPRVLSFWRQGLGSAVPGEN
jgi:hypothetical protein